MNPDAEPKPSSADQVPDMVYEQPLNERLRTFLRLEFLYRQLRYHLDQSSPWDSRATITSMLDIIAILTRGDVRSDVLKELERQLTTFDQLQNRPQVDGRRLEGILRNLRQHRQVLSQVAPQYLMLLRENEFLNAIKHRSAIPGGTCEFDLPDYTHWLRQPEARRKSDVEHWLGGLQPLCEGLAELLWLMRAGSGSSNHVATNGFFQHSLGRDTHCNMLRVLLPDDTTIYPEISASQHRFSVRFMHWSDVATRAVQVDEDVSFELQLC
jgi:cell division protein ZapD